MNIYNPKINEIELSEIISIDCEFTSLDVLEARCIVISINNPVLGINYALDCGKYTKDEIVSLLNRVRECKLVIAHNSKIDIGILSSNYGALLRNCYCTLLASQILDNGYGYQIKRELLYGTAFAKSQDKIYYTKNMIGGIEMMPSPHGLLGCIRRFLGITLSETVEKKRLQRSFIDFPEGKTVSEEQLAYACSDVNYLYPLYLEQQKYIAEREMQTIVALENKLTPVLIQLESKGCLIDQQAHIENIKKWKAKLYSIELEMDEIVRSLGANNIRVRGGVFANKRLKQEVAVLDIFGNIDQVIENENLGNLNYSSSAQIVDLFRRLELPLPIDDAGKVSFGEEPVKMYMTTYSESILRPFLALLLDYRQYGKLLSTYGENLLNLVDKNGRMRTTYTQCFTNTGRLTSSAVIKDQIGLNLANIPQDNDVRNIFIPDKGYSFVDCDMTGQEVAIVAGYSGEDVLLDAMRNGFDHHSFLASISYSIIFNRKVEIKNSDEYIEVDNFKYKLKILRNDHKSALFSKIYLGGPKRIQNILNEYLTNHISAAQRFSACEEISRQLDKAMPKLIKYLKEKVAFANKNGYISTTIWNRRRYFDYPEKAYGDAANMDIQATGGMSIKLALINVDKWLETKSQELGIIKDELGWITMSIYDQNLVCLNNKYLEYAPEIQKIMADSLTYFLKDLQGSSDMKITQKWEK